jgi:hypothetical protein
MTKVVVNRCYGGFSVSLAAARRMAELGHVEAAEEVREHDEKLADPSKLDDSERKYGVRWYGFICRDRKERADPTLVQTVEELGDAANGEFSKLDIADVPDDAEWTIEEHDGREWVAEVHRTW